MPTVIHDSDVGRGLAIIASKLIATQFTSSAIDPVTAPAATDPLFHVNTATNGLFGWTGAAWVPLGAAGGGTTADGTTTLAGSVELATTTEIHEGVGTGTDGPLVITPNRMLVVPTLTAAEVLALDPAIDKVWVRRNAAGEMAWMNIDDLPSASGGATTAHSAGQNAGDWVFGRPAAATHTMPAGPAGVAGYWRISMLNDAIVSIAANAGLAVNPTGTWVTNGAGNFVQLGNFAATGILGGAVVHSVPGDVLVGSPSAGAITAEWVAT